MFKAVPVVAETSWRHEAYVDHEMRGRPTLGVAGLLPEPVVCLMHRRHRPIIATTTGSVAEARTIGDGSRAVRQTLSR